MPEQRDTFSDQSFAVQITLADQGDLVVVDQVLIGGRPAGLYGLAAKSHLVPWLAFCDGLRAEVAGQHLFPAIERVLIMAGWAERLPSQRVADALRSMTHAEITKAAGSTAVPAAKAAKTAAADTGVDSVYITEVDENDLGATVHTPAYWYRVAGEHLAAARRDAEACVKNGYDQELAVEALQDLMAAYLHYRNTVPLTAVAMPNPSGPPDASAVRAWEDMLSDPRTKPDATEPTTITAAMWKLLDTRALDYLEQTPEGLLDVARLGDRREGLGALVIADHVVTMELTYPRCAAATKFRERVLRDLSASRANAAKSAIADFSRSPEVIGKRLRRPEPPPGGDTSVRETRDDYERFAVQLASPNGPVERMYVGSRPRSPAGRHATAWVALCDYTRALIHGATADAVEGRLNTARGTLNAIAAALGRQQPVMPPRAIENATLLSGAQRAIAQFLADLNTLPGSIADTGGTSGGAAEAMLRRQALSEAGLTPLVKMLDPKVLAFDTDPGVEQRIALRLALHLEMVRTAYPNAAKPSDLISENALAAFLSPVDVRAQEADIIGGEVFRVLRPSAPYDPERYRIAADRFSSARTQAASTGKSKGKHLLEDTDYRLSQDSDDDSD